LDTDAVSAAGSAEYSSGADDDVEEDQFDDDGNPISADDDEVEHDDGEDGDNGHGDQSQDLHFVDGDSSTHSATAAMNQDSAEVEDDGDGCDSADLSEDAELDTMDPRDMDEEEQIRFLQRQHIKEQRQQQMRQQQQQQQQLLAHHSTPLPSDSVDFFATPVSASHVTPPTRSARAAAASAAATAASSNARRLAPPSSARSHIPSNARRILDLDSSNDSMVVDTPPPRAISHAPSTPAMSFSLCLMCCGCCVTSCGFSIQHALMRGR